MVCLACLLPLFLIPVVNALPVLYHLIMGKIYRIFGWEYTKPQRVPPACPYRPAAKQNSNEELQPLAGQQHPPPKAVDAEDAKQD
ncbi:hypothetical protein SDJN03_09669, partial [Cucurbita argyrosperma subsp. sororia]